MPSKGSEPAQRKTIMPGFTHLHFCMGMIVTYVLRVHTQRANANFFPAQNMVMVRCTNDALGEIRTTKWFNVAYAMRTREYMATTNLAIACTCDIMGGNNFFRGTCFVGNVSYFDISQVTYVGWMSSRSSNFNDELLGWFVDMILATSPNFDCSAESKGHPTTKP